MFIFGFKDDLCFKLKVLKISQEKLTVDLND
jgi:hypothetical protein